MAGTALTGEISKDLHKELYRKMVTVRSFEECLTMLDRDGLIHGTMHLAVGEEASVVGACCALKTDDYIFTTHRGHGEAIAKGADIDRMMAEMLGRTGSTNGGIGGSMHMTAPEVGVIGGNGVVGAGVPLSLGAALYISYKQIADRVSVCFFGDGAANQGAVLESMNLAGVKKLPMIFVLIDNAYAVSTRVEEASAEPDFSRRAEPFGLEPFTADGNDVTAVYDTVREARGFAAFGRGPALVVLHTYRMSGHSRTDDNVYRSGAELARYAADDPILRYEEKLSEAGIFSLRELRLVRKGAEDEVRSAVEYALRRPHADMSRSELEASVYAG